MRDNSQVSDDAIAQSTFDHLLGLERELHDFPMVLGPTVTKEGLRAWAKESVIRADILEGTLWGSIRWRKTLGRPLVSTLASAFVIEHLSWKEVLDINNGVGRWIRLTVPHPEPSKWDAAGNDEFYQVNFMASSPSLETRIRVDFAPNVTWDRRIQMIAGYNDLEPESLWFAKGTAPRVLPPFEVLRKPFSVTDI
jgi:hypothetical protein